MSHPRAKFEAAVAALVAEGAVKSRLRRAFEENLEGIEDAELPKSIRAAFCELNQALHQVGPAGHQTCLRATVQKMSAEQASQYAHQIVDIYIELVAASERVEPLKVVEKSDSSAQIVTA